VPNPQEIDLKQLGSILSRRRRLILTTAGSCLAVAVAVNLITRPIYVAKVSIEVRKEPNRSPLTGEAIAMDQWQSDNIAVFTAAELVTNRTLIGEVALKLNERGLLQMPSKPRLPFLGPSRGTPAGGDRASVGELDREIDWLIAITTVRPVRDTRLFNVEVEHWNPATATSIADVLANTYASSQARWLATADTGRAGEMSQQMEETRKRTTRLETSLNASSSKAPVILAERLKQLTDAISGLNVSYVETQTNRLGVDARLARVRTVLRDSLRDPGDLPVQSETLDGLWRNLLARQTELARAREVYRDGHPKVMMLVSELRNIRESIRAELAKTVSALDQEHAVLLEREQNLRSTIALREAQLHRASDLLAQQATIQSELQSSRALYDKLLTRAQEDQVSGAVRYPLVRVIGSATVGSKPVRPHRLLNMVLGVMVGLLSGTGLALLQEYLRQTIRTPVDAAEQLQLPVLGMIPKRTKEWSDSRA